MLRYIDSFDHYNTATANRKGWTLNNGSGTAAIVAAAGRNGTAALHIQGTGSTQQPRATRGITVSGNVCVVGFAFKRTTAMTAIVPVVSIVQGGTAAFTVWVSSGGTLQVRAGSNPAGALLGSSSSDMGSGVWAHIQFRATVAGSSGGSMELYLDGSSVLTLSGVSFSATGWSDICLGAFAPQNWTNPSDLYYDDLYVCDGSGGVDDDVLGDHRMIACLPTGIGDLSQWTPLSGDNYTQVDENPPDLETTHVYASTAGITDTYPLSAVGVSATVKAVQGNHLSKCDVAGVRTLSHVSRIGGTNYEHPTPVSQPSDWLFSRYIMTESPATSSPWTVSEIDGAEFGPKVNS